MKSSDFIPNERPMIFNGDMVRALLDGRKTQTRRPVKCIHKEGPWYRFVRKHKLIYSADTDEFKQKATAEVRQNGITLPGTGRIRIGDRIWVKETWDYEYDISDEDQEIIKTFLYRASGDQPFEGRWQPSIHMPRIASRILLEITDLRIEQLLDMSDDDALAEGVMACAGGGYGSAAFHYPVSSFDQDIWQPIYAGTDYAWTNNPMLPVIEFKRVKQ